MSQVTQAPDGRPFATTGTVLPERSSAPRRRVKDGARATLDRAKLGKGLAKCSQHSARGVNGTAVSDGQEAQLCRSTFAAGRLAQYGRQSSGLVNSGQAAALALGGLALGVMIVLFWTGRL